MSNRQVGQEAPCKCLFIVVVCAVLAIGLMARPAGAGTITVAWDLMAITRSRATASSLAPRPAVHARLSTSVPTAPSSSSDRPSWACATSFRWRPNSTIPPSVARSSEVTAVGTRTVAGDLAGGVRVGDPSSAFRVRRRLLRGDARWRAPSARLVARRLERRGDLRGGGRTTRHDVPGHGGAHRVRGRVRHCPARDRSRSAVRHHRPCLRQRACGHATRRRPTSKCCACDTSPARLPSRRRSRRASRCRSRHPCRFRSTETGCCTSPCRRPSARPVLRERPGLRSGRPCACRTASADAGRGARARPAR